MIGPETIERRERTADFISDHMIKYDGMPPTYQAIADKVGHSTKSLVASDLEALHKSSDSVIGFVVINGRRRITFKRMPPNAVIVSSLLARINAAAEKDPEIRVLARQMLCRCVLCPVKFCAHRDWQPAFKDNDYGFGL